MILLVAVCGGIGAAARYVVDGALAARNRRGYPVGTLVINVTGSFLLGFLVAWAANHGPGSAPIRTAIGTGLLGGYTTFSTACVEVVRLARSRRPGTATALAMVMLLFSVAAAAAGQSLGART